MVRLIQNTVPFDKAVALELLGTQWRTWLRHCATSRKVVGSVPDGVTGIFR
jgi:hypothetical protein